MFLIDSMTKSQKYLLAMLCGNEPHLSLVVPAFNEATRLPQSLRKIIEFGAGLGFSYEVVVVVERSTDGTLELAREAAAKQANFQIIDNQVKRGKGYAVRSGMLKARGDCIFYMDADLSVPLDDVLFFLDYFHNHPEADVLIGNRGHAGSRIIKRQALLRQKLGRLFNRLIQLFSLTEVRDTQCGFKAFRRKTAHEIFSRQRLNGFAFDVEVLLLADKLGCKIVDLPVRWVNSPESKVSILCDSLQMLGDTLRVRRLVERTLMENPPPAR
jgi:dolichyl-phosphate beta-glucosyltransferase